jgi:hypothetical protein
MGYMVSEMYWLNVCVLRKGISYKLSRLDCHALAIMKLNTGVCCSGLRGTQKPETIVI